MSQSLALGAVGPRAIMSRTWIDEIARELGAGVGTTATRV